MFLLAWIPESLLNEKGSAEWDKFFKVEEQPVVADDDEGTCFGLSLLIVLDPFHRCGPDRPSNTATGVLRIFCTADFHLLSHRASTLFVVVV